MSLKQGGHSSVRLRFVHGMFRAVPVLGSDGSFGERVSRYFGRGTVPVLDSVPEKRFRLVPVPL